MGKEWSISSLDESHKKEFPGSFPQAQLARLLPDPRAAAPHAQGTTSQSMIVGPLARVTRGQPRSLGTARDARSAPVYVAQLTSSARRLLIFRAQLVGVTASKLPASRRVGILLGVAARCAAGAFGTLHTVHSWGRYVTCRADVSTDAG